MAAVQGVLKLYKTVLRLIGLNNSQFVGHHLIITLKKKFVLVGGVGGLYLN